MKISRTIIGLNFVIYLALVLAVWAAPSGHFVLVLTDPTQKTGYGISVIGRAGGSFVATGRYDWMTVGYSEERDFPTKLMRAGALLVLNHQLALGCLKGNEE
ncbi:hypothetical protein JNB91_08180 [Rhizobium wenxiniae]|uniref:hypothetical protein n=1 Tax=Rhizobium wenxiniae TaxID=1737357 RepID=UPI001C6E76ED|nr:hypothetical protein [Rhizobium wenxiniae]MBW9087821.1 hypothetical protein [Rhizobium wenxiniae]